jgi:NADP-dependent 3-hydroxy acid dehydrogenase YdfG
MTVTVVSHSTSNQGVVLPGTLRPRASTVVPRRLLGSPRDGKKERTMDQRSVALVTGASSGIGRAVASRLATDGMTVVAAARRADRLVELADGTDGAIVPRELDVTDRGAVKSAVDNVIARHGRIDVLVANAGVMPLSRLDALLVDEWDRMIDANVRGLLHGIAAVLQHFAQQQRGHVVTIASIGAHEVVGTAAVYCGTKHAAWAITEGLRLESRHGCESRRSRPA